MLLDKKLQTIIQKQVEDKAYQEAIKKELDIIYPSLVAMAEHGLKEINTPIGTWKFEVK